MINIRLATHADIPGMASLLRTLFEQEVEFAPNEGDQILGLETILDSPSVGRLIVCERNGDIIGMVNLLFTVSTALGARVALLEDMVVVPELRRRGIGRLLVEKAIEQCRSDNCHRITLLTDQDNMGAHAFYERAGFERSTMVPFRHALS